MNHSEEPSISAPSGDAGGQGARTGHRGGLHDVSVTFLSLTGMAALTLLSQWMLAFMLLPEGRGAYAICMVFGVLLGMAFTPGAQQGAQYFVSAREISLSQGVAAALAVTLVGCSLAAALAIPLIYSELAYFQKAETGAFLLALALIPTSAFSISVNHQLVALRRFRRLAVVSLLRISVNVLAITLLVWRLDWGVNGAVAALVAGHCVAIAVGLLDLRRNCELSLEWPARPNLRRIFGYGIKFYAARIGYAIEPHIGVVALGLLADQREIGLFATASAVMVGFMLLSNAVGNALYPRVAGLERSELVARCLRLVGMATVVAILPFLAVSRPLVEVALTQSYLPIVILLWIMAPGILANALGGILITHFKGNNRPAVCSWAVSLGLVVNIGALVLLHPWLGVVGAAGAMSGGMVCRLLLLLAVFHKTTGVSLARAWLGWRGDASYLWSMGRSALRRS